MVIVLLLCRVVNTHQFQHVAAFFLEVMSAAKKVKDAIPIWTNPDWFLPLSHLYRILYLNYTKIYFLNTKEKQLLSR